MGPMRCSQAPPNCGSLRRPGQVVRLDAEGDPGRYPLLSHFHDLIGGRAVDLESFRFQVFPGNESRSQARRLEGYE